jgi:hypothetical protein
MRYIGGCKCLQCRAANSSYEVGRAAARKAGDWNGVVSAESARMHILALSSAGVGRRSIAEASDVAETIIVEIKSGRRMRIRARTSRKILDVTAQAARDGAYIDASPAWKQIRELLREGFTKCELAHRLGVGNSIQFGKKRMAAKSVAKVDRFYRTIMAE